MSKMKSLPAVLVADTMITKDESGRLNLNAMHRASDEGRGKSPAHWLRLDGTRELIERLEVQLLKTQICVLKTIHGGRHAGTFAHEILAVAYAAWVSPDFHIKVINAFIASHQPSKAVPKPREWYVERLEARDSNVDAAEALKETRELVGKGTAGHHYSNEHRMVNEILFGMSAKKWLAHGNYDPGTNISEVLPPFELAVRNAMMKVNESLIRVDMSFPERKQRISNGMEGIVAGVIGRARKAGSLDALMGLDGEPLLLPPAI